MSHSNQTSKTRHAHTYTVHNSVQRRALYQDKTLTLWGSHTAYGSSKSGAQLNSVFVGVVSTALIMSSSQPADCMSSL